jgi:serine/threonine protein kinase/Tfp pilus assembly protein PilF
MSNCPNDDDLQRYHSKELDGAEEARVREHLSQCADCARRSEALLAEHEELLDHMRGMSLPETEKVGQKVPIVDAPSDKTLEVHKSGESSSFAPPPDSFPGYTIIREIHRGGQGVVYQALQQSTKRKVAIKVLLEGPYASPAAQKRFEREIELVASLKHANIIEVFHSGITTDGRHFYVMDYVRGIPLHRYVREKQLALEDALKLFSMVCEAVNYAHQKGVIHRDLKPTNILVDSNGYPKVLDFGLAKMVGGPEQTIVSLTGQVVGTLPYMSPEQAKGNPDEIDIRTDVYALGVILYEILTGQYPYPVAGQMADVLKHIAETPPTPPSRSWKRDSGVAKRSTRRVRAGDCPIDDEVQTIVLKTLSKERERRYQSAGELARDIEHYLAGEPVEAKRDSALYVFRKQLRRYRRPVMAGCLVALALVAGLIGTTTFALRARDEAERAEAALVREAEQRQLAEENEQKAKDNEVLALERAEQTRQVAEFQASMLSGIDAEEMGRTIVGELRNQVRAGLERTWVEGDDGKMRKRTDEEIAAALEQFNAAVAPANPTDVARQMMDISVLKPAVDAITEEFVDQPQVQAQLLDTIGMVYRSLGQYDSGEPHLRQALELCRRTFGDEHVDVAASLSSLGVILGFKGDYDEAEALQREALAIRRKLLGNEHPDVATSLNNLAVVLKNKGDYAEAESLYREALALRRKLLGNEHPDVATSLNNLAVVLKDRGDYAEAESLYREALALRRKVQGNEHPLVATGLNNLAVLLKARGDYAAAEPLYRAALALYRKLLGDEHPNVARTLNNLGNLLCARGDYAAAEPLYREALALDRRLLGNEHPNVARSLDNLGTLLAARGDYFAAEPLLREALTLRRKLLGNEHRLVAKSVNSLAVLLRLKGDYIEAEPLYRESLALLRKLLGEEHYSVATSMNNLAVLLHTKGDYAAAERLYRDVLALRRKLLGDEHPDVAATLDYLGFLLRDNGDYAAAEPLFREALAIRSKVFGDEHVDVGRSLDHLGLLLQAKGDYAAAEPLLREALALRRKLLGDEHPRVATSLNNLGLLLTDKGDYAAAEPLLREALALRRKLLGDEHPRVATSLNNLGLLLKAKGDYAAAEPLLRKALALRRKLLGDEHPHVATTLDNLAALLKAQSDYATAEELYREALAIFEKKLPPAHAYTESTRGALGRTLTKLGRYDEAEALLLMAQETLAQTPSAQPRFVIRVLQGLVELYEARHEAEPGQGYDAKAAEWRMKLEQWQATAQSSTTQPATTEPAASESASSAEVQTPPK